MHCFIFLSLNLNYILFKDAIPPIAIYLFEKKKVEIFPTDAAETIKVIINQIIERRKSGTERRDDFIQSIIEYEDDETTTTTTSKKTISNSDILSQAIVFLMAGYDTTMNALSFISHCLAANLNHQETLCQEIDSILEKYVSLYIYF